jgi:DNA-binding protein HU-beta
MADEKTEQESTSGTIGRQELAKRIAKEAKLSQKQAAEVLEATLNTIRDALKNGDEVRFNPRDRQPIEVPAKDRVRFSPGKELSEAVIKKP